MDGRSSSNPAVLERPAPEAGHWRRAEPSMESVRGRGRLPALLQAPPLPPEELQSLREWLAGAAALRPDAAWRLLERAVDRRQLVDEPGLHMRAVKARIAGDANWAPMGFKLVLD